MDDSDKDDNNCSEIHHTHKEVLDKALELVVRKRFGCSHLRYGCYQC